MVNDLPDSDCEKFLRIIHVATYISRDGAFGGPIAVAAAQLEELARRGHEVELIAGWDGLATVELRGVKVSLFKANQLLPVGFSGLWAPGLLAYLRGRITANTTVHIHAGRDLISLACAQMLKLRNATYVLQTHGMIMPDRRYVSRILDFAITRRILRGASCVLTLTPVEEVGLSQVGKSRVNVRRIANGIALPIDAPAVRGNPNEVLFLARLHSRKRVLAFAGMAKLLHEDGVVAKFVVVGPDEGDLPALLSFVGEHSLESVFTYEGPIAMADARKRLARADVYVLPSRGEVFPMTVLESLSVGTPVVTTADSGIAGELSSSNAAIVTDGSPDALAKAVQSILRDTDLQRRLAANGLEAVSAKFSISAVGRVLESIYQKA